MGLDAATLQRRMFYNTNWIVEMEKTLMDTLVDQIVVGLDEPISPDSYSKSRNARAYMNLPDPSWESMVIVFHNPTQDESEDDELNIQNRANGDRNDEMDVNNLHRL
ncbi:hypothetical protein Salat_1893900 [Sesamum alatum]|uniref:Uncharacterized protein n=1 Tax=Sesamum alatum TaxID=300844 RepID=A0AAE1Y3R0_9LAMI|nr:hypothetical protein Salat_1893900 [Sesamum alatum]